MMICIACGQTGGHIAECITMKNEPNFLLIGRIGAEPIVQCEWPPCRALVRQVNWLDHKQGHMNDKAAIIRANNSFNSMLNPNTQPMTNWDSLHAAKIAALEQEIKEARERLEALMAVAKNPVVSKKTAVRKRPRPRNGWANGRVRPVTDDGTTCLEPYRSEGQGGLFVRCSKPKDHEDGPHIYVSPDNKFDDVAWTMGDVAVRICWAFNDKHMVNCSFIEDHESIYHGHLLKDPVRWLKWTDDGEEIFDGDNIVPGGSFAYKDLAHSVTSLGN